MQKYLRILIFFCAVSLIAACKKDSKPIISIPQIKNVKGNYTLPPSASYTLTEERTYNYNNSGQLTQSTLKTFIGASLNQQQSIDHEYTNGRLTSSTSSVFGPVVFTYNNNGQIVTQKRDMGSTVSDQVTYNANGSLATLVLVSAGIDNPWTCVYNYSANGLLANIAITTKLDPNSAGTIYFTNYTDECDFDPLILNELMDLYSFFPPFAMNGWKRLPQQVNYVFKDGSGDNNRFYTYTINNRKIEKMTRVRVYPDQTTDLKCTYSFSY